MYYYKCHTLNYTTISSHREKRGKIAFNVESNHNNVIYVCKKCDHYNGKLLMKIKCKNYSGYSIDFVYTTYCGCGDNMKYGICYNDVITKVKEITKLDINTNQT